MDDTNRSCSSTDAASHLFEAGQKALARQKPSLGDLPSDSSKCYGVDTVSPNLTELTFMGLFQHVDSSEKL